MTLRLPARTVATLAAAVTFTLLVIFVLSTPGDGLSVTRLVQAGMLAAVQAAALLWVFHHPVRVFAVALVAGVGLEALDPNAGWLGLVGVPLTFVARLRPRRISLPALGVVLLATPWKLLTADHRTFLLVVAGTVLAWALGDLGRVSQIRRAAERRRVVADERARIARELHDVVAHHVSVIVVQASAAEDVIDTRPERAREALVAIQAAGRSALGELRTLVGSLSDAEPDLAGVAPQPDLDGLDDLVAAVRAAGLAVELRRAGRTGRLPAAVSRSAYRIIQESLTNTLRHADAARSVVTVRQAPDNLHIDVVDTGPARAGRRDTSGRGLVGMRERVRLHGGTLTAGPAPDGGFQVRATLPLREVR